ncbi:DNA-directed RNA polymerase subunit beta [Mycoplasmatota bacterium]|nr:DNA-directed RNA polymerase subunit beta [Mycoplasmatota bacterium]
MNYKVEKFGRHRERRNYSRVKLNAELPGLIDIQLNSFEWFLNDGLKELFDYISPIENHAGNIKMYFGDYEFEEPVRDIAESKRREVNYSSKLKVNVKLVFEETGEIKEQKLYLGDVPMMTPEGTFVINGAQRVIVTQIIRSAGVYFTKEFDKKRNDIIHAGQVIPTRGAWLEFEIKSKDELYVKLDRSKKLELSVLARALGVSKNEEIIDLLGDSKHLLETLAKDSTTDTDSALLKAFSTIRNGEQGTVDGSKGTIIARFFDPKRYDLAPVGRYKVNKKLDVLERAKGLILAQDIVNNETGEIVVENGTLIDDETVNIINQNRDSITRELNYSGNWFDDPIYVESLDVNIKDGEDYKVIRVVGNYSKETLTTITPSDIFASMSYYINLFDGAGYDMVIDHLQNRRLRLIGELLQNQFRIGLTKIDKRIRENMSTKDPTEMKPSNLIESKQLSSTIKEFFGSSQLSQFMQQTNPLDELTHKRRISALGPGGLSRERASYEVRDVHYSHYGRICPIETPEGPNIGLINSLSIYAKVNKYGFIETPYYKVDKETGRVLDEKLEYLSADVEEKFVIGQANIKLDKDNVILDTEIVARYNGETKLYKTEKVDYIDVSPKQIVSVSTACIPFLEHDDANRALMGSNMQRQAIPLLRTEAPFVGTGIEHKAAQDSGSAIVAREDGVVEYVDANKIVTKTKDGERTYDLQKFKRSNQSTNLTQRPIVKVGDKLKKSDIIADGSAMDKGELAVGRNVTVAFMTWNGYNYEDAIVMSENLVIDDVYTSIHIEDYQVEVRDTKVGKEEITREIPGAESESLRNLDERGIVRVGAEVKAGQIVVGKITPKGQADLSNFEKLIFAIYSEKARDVKDTSLRVPHGGGGIVAQVQYFSTENGDELSSGVNELVRVYIVQKRKIHEGDKMAGRHGNKGVISKILPVEDMPFLEDGTPVDIMLNPLGVPSRMNIGQILEIHLGMAAKKLGVHIATPVFDGVKANDLALIMDEAGMAPDGKTAVYDGRTGIKYDNRVSVGVMYMVKLAHMVDDKLHARSVGPYILVTQQPMGGKAQNGGQRFGEMEVWALEAYGAAYTLQEILTVKSDDIIGRNKVFKAIVNGTPIPEGSVPESFRVLIKELQALGISVKLITTNGEDEVNKSLVQDGEEDYITKFGIKNM